MSSAQPPYPPPMPLSPLEYSAPLQSGRPGILTAVGIISIVVACLSGMASLSGLMMSAGFAMMSRVSIPAKAFSPPPSGVVPPGGQVTIGGIPAPEYDGSDGLPPAQSKIAGDLLAQMGSIDGHRRKHLDLLLAVAGHNMFPSPSGPLTTTSIRRNISDFGVIPAPGGGAGTVFFVIGTGRIEVYDDHALYRPDGSDDVVTVTAPADDSAAVTPSGGAPVNSSSPGVQTQTTVTTVTNGRRSTTTFSSASPITPFKISAFAAGLSVLEALGSLLLAVYLLVAGIMVLRNSLKGAKLHWIYVIIKIPLVIVAIIATWWLWSGFFTSMSTAMPSPGAPPAPVPARFIVMMVVMVGAIALIYPVALIFVLSSRTVREYYNAVRA